MLKACRGADLRDKRDEAILRLMFTTGAPAGEVVALQVKDLSLRSDPATATIRHGEGGTGRVVPLAPRSPRPSTATSAPARPTVWPGRRRCGWGTGAGAFTYDALHKTLAMRAELAGVAAFHPHMLRHTAAHRWLAKGGSEGGLMAVVGWTRPDMLVRYTPEPPTRHAASTSARSDLAGRRLLLGRPARSLRTLLDRRLALGHRPVHSKQQVHTPLALRLAMYR